MTPVWDVAPHPRQPSERRPARFASTTSSRFPAALRRADQDDPGPLGELLARAVLDNLYKFIVPAIAGAARLVALPALATDELSANALRVAAIRGRLKAAKASDGTWRSSRAWVDEYIASRYKRTWAPHRSRRPKPASTPKSRSPASRRESYASWSGR